MARWHGVVVAMIAKRNTSGSSPANANHGPTMVVTTESGLRKSVTMPLRVGCVVKVQGLAILGKQIMYGKATHYHPLHRRIGHAILQEAINEI